MPSTGWGKLGDFAGVVMLVLVIIAGLVGFGGQSFGALPTAFWAGGVVFVAALIHSNWTLKTTGFRYPFILGGGAAAYIGASTSIWLGGAFGGLIGGIVAGVLTFVLSYVFFFGQALILGSAFALGSFLKRSNKK